MPIHSNLATRTRPSQRPTLSVVRTSQLQESKEAPTRGLAHVGFLDLPEGAPGKLDFEPLLLCAVGMLEPGERAEMHPHDNIDNIVLLRAGAVVHRDDHGNHGLLRAGEAHLLAAGESIQHEETVHGSETAHAVVIWIRPEQRGGPSHYFQWKPSQAAKRNGWSLVASGRPHSAGRALPLRRDAELLSAKLKADAPLDYCVDEGRRAYLVVLEGRLLVNETPVSAGERVLVESSGELRFTANFEAELLLIDLASP